MDIENQRYARSWWLSMLNRYIALFAAGLGLLAAAIFLIVRLSIGYQDSFPHFWGVVGAGAIIALGAMAVNGLNDSITDTIYNRIYRRKDGEIIYEECPLQSPFWRDMARDIAPVEARRMSGDDYFAAGMKYFGEGRHRKAFIHFCCGARLGHPDSLYCAGVYYINGVSVMHNWRKGLELLRKSAEAGSESGIKWLARACYEGIYVPRHLEEAAKWLPQAAELGDADCMFYLARLYAEGLYVERDTDKAIKLCDRAANLGHRKAAEYAERLRSN